MKVTFISDTHTAHNSLGTLPGGDILIFSGDFMNSGYNEFDIYNFMDWLKDQPYEYKVVVAGNHDRFMEFSKLQGENIISDYYDYGIRYLIDSGIDIKGLKIYGTPYQPYFCNWAFNVRDDEKLYGIYKMIPENVDILVTHCPPYGILDRSHVVREMFGTNGEEPLGSKALLKVLDELGDKAPRYVAFGHIHGDGGKVERLGNTTYINASVCNEAYKPINEIVTIEIDERDAE